LYILLKKLNHDFDFFFSEMAPLDSLAHSQGFSEKLKVYVYGQLVIKISTLTFWHDQEFTIMYKPSPEY
jgi:hypothetical protein